MSKKLKIIFLAGWVLTGFLPHLTLAANVPPEQNPLCWTKQTCTAVLKVDGKLPPGFNIEEHFVAGGVNGECGEGVGEGARGYCIPAGQTQAQITIGGENKFKDLGQYLPNLYKYLVSIAGIVAAILIIKGGFDYLTSAGDSSKVTAAKETIGNAIMGLILVLGSYVVLQTVNPELVNLKLPGVYMIRPVTTAKWCAELEAGTKVALADGKELKDIGQADYHFSNTNTFCGKTYFYPDGRGSTCHGRICPKESGGQACLLREKTGKCVEGFLAGVIKIEAKETAKKPTTLYQMKLQVLCRDEEDKIYEYTAAELGGVRQVAAFDEEQQAQVDAYAFTKFDAKAGAEARKPCRYKEIGCYLELSLGGVLTGESYFIDRSGQNVKKEDLQRASLFNCNNLGTISADKLPAQEFDINVTEARFPKSSEQYIKK